MSSLLYINGGIVEALKIWRESEKVRIGIRERVGERAGEDWAGVWETWSNKIGRRGVFCP